MKVFITGATKGIGKSMAIYAAQKGADLVLTARNEEDLAELSAEIQEKFKVQVIYKAADLSKKEGISKITEYLIQENPEALINNAGAASFKSFQDSAIEKEIELINLNIIAPIQLSHAFLNNGKNKKILFVSSTVAFRAAEEMALYSASKSFIHNFAQSLRSENIGSQISVLYPGKTATAFKPGNSGGLKAEFVAKAAFEGLINGQNTIVPGMITKFKILIYKLMPAVVTNFITKFIR